MAVAIVLLIVVVLSVLFNFVSPWWFGEIASNWGSIDFTVFVTFWICGIVFILVGLFMVYTVWKYKYREGAQADYEPENSKLEGWLTIITTIGVVLMLTPGLVVWDDYVNVPPEAHEVEVLGEQWDWSFRLPGEDGILGTAKIEYISSKNPFGIDDEDPYGEDDILIDDREIHLPINQPVKMLLRSKDVLHDFFVPEFRAKMDIVPGMVTYFWFEPTKVGTFEILCAELCGVGHHAMRGFVHVDTEEDYAKWLATGLTYADLKSGAQPTHPGFLVAEANGCFACHTTDGSEIVGPTWQGLWGSEKSFTDGTSAPVDDAYIRESVVDPGAKIVEGFAPAMIPYQLSDEDMQALIEYLQTLGNTSASTEPAIETDAPVAAEQLALVAPLATSRQ